jgi:hypothetical protein
MKGNYFGLSSLSLAQVPQGYVPSDLRRILATYALSRDRALATYPLILRRILAVCPLQAEIAHRKPASFVSQMDFGYATFAGSPPSKHEMT